MNIISMMTNEKTPISTLSTTDKDIKSALIKICIGIATDPDNKMTYFRSDESNTEEDKLEDKIEFNLIDNIIEIYNAIDKNISIDDLTLFIKNYMKAKGLQLFYKLSSKEYEEHNKSLKDITNDNNIKITELESQIKDLIEKSRLDHISINDKSDRINQMTVEIGDMTHEIRSLKEDQTKQTAEIARWTNSSMKGMMTLRN